MNREQGDVWHLDVLKKKLHYGKWRLLCVSEAWPRMMHAKNQDFSPTAVSVLTFRGWHFLTWDSDAGWCEVFLVLMSHHVNVGLTDLGCLCKFYLVDLDTASHLQAELPSYPCENRPDFMSWHIIDVCFWRHLYPLILRSVQISDEMI